MCATRRVLRQLVGDAPPRRRGAVPTPVLVLERDPSGAQLLDAAQERQGDLRELFALVVARHGARVRGWRVRVAEAPPMLGRRDPHPRIERSVSAIRWVVARRAGQATGMAAKASGDVTCCFDREVRRVPHLPGIPQEVREVERRANRPQVGAAPRPDGSEVEQPLQVRPVFVAFAALVGGRARRRGARASPSTFVHAYTLEGRTGTPASTHSVVGYAPTT